MDRSKVCNNRKKIYKTPRRKVSTLYSITKVLIFILRALGRFPYFMKNGKMYVTISSPITLASGAFYCFVVYIMYTAATPVYQNTFQNEDMDSALFTVVPFLVIFFNASFPFTSWFEWSNLCRYYNDWANFEEELSKRTEIKQDQLLNKIVIIVSIIEIPSVVLFFFIQKDIIPYVSWAFIILITVSCIVVQIIFFLTLFGCLILRSASDSLLEHAIKVIQGSEEVTDQELHSCRMLWSSIAKLSSSLTNALAPSLIWCLLNSGIGFVVTSYALLYTFKMQRITKYTFPFLSTLVMMLICVYLLCDVCERTSKKIGVKFHAKLLTLNDTVMGEKAQKEMKMFNQSFYIIPTAMSCNGFFAMNRRMFVSFISTTTTYLIVLIQLGKSEQPCS